MENNSIININEIKPNVCWSVNQNILNHNGKNLFFHSIDKKLLKFIKLISSKEGKFVFLYPIANFQLLLPLSIELMYNFMQIDPQKRNILVLSKNRSLIDKYLELNINCGYFHVFPFPLGVITAKGNVNLKVIQGLGKSRIDEEIHFYFSNSVESVLKTNQIKNIRAIIVDSNFIRGTEELEKIKELEKNLNCRLTLYFEINPYSNLIEYALKEKIPLYVWPEKEVKKDYLDDKEESEKNPEKYNNIFSSSIKEIKNKVEGFENKYVLADKNEDFLVLLNNLRKLYNQMKKNSKNDFEYRISKKYLQLIKNIEHLLTPPQYLNSERQYFLFSRSFEDQIDIISNLNKILEKENEYLSQIIKEALYEVEKSLKLLDKDNEKGRYVLEIVNEAITQNKSLLILSKNLAHANSLSKYIKEKFKLTDEKLMEYRIEIKSQTNFNFEKKIFDLCVISGFPDKNSRGLMKTAIGKRIVFLFYPFEVKLFNYIKEKDNFYLKSLFKSKNRYEFFNIVKLQPNMDFNEELSELEELKYKLPTEIEENKSFFEEIIIDEENAEIEKNDILIDEKEGTEISNKVQDGYKILFSDNSYIYQLTKSHLRIIDNKNDIKIKNPNEIKLNDLVLLVDNSSTDTLANYLFKSAEFHPKLQEITILYLSWISCLKEGMKKKKINFVDLYQKMVNKGTEIKTPQAIFFWSKELVFQMRNKNNINLVGRILDEPYLVNSSDEIYSAMGKLKSIHRKLISYLKKVALDNFNYDDKEEYLDEELNLTKEELAKIIKLKKVTNIEKVKNLKYSDLNKLKY